MKPTRDYDLVCIGSGPAGQRAAVQAAKLGKRVAVVEKLRCVGGVCLGTGTIPSKTLREAVLLLSRIPGRHDPGRATPPGARPTVDQLLARVEKVLAREQDVIEDQLRRNDVATVRGEASFSDPHTLMVRGEDGLLSADGLQLPNAGRVLQGRRPRRLQQAARLIEER